MKIKAKDASTERMEIPILERNIDFKKYDIKNCKYLKIKNEYQRISDSYTSLSKAFGLKLIQFLLLWFTFSNKTATTHKCMQAGIGERNTCANNFTKLVELGYCNKYSMGNGYHNSYILTNEGIDLFIKMIKQVETIDSF